MVADPAPTSSPADRLLRHAGIRGADADGAPRVAAQGRRASSRNQTGRRGAGIVLPRRRPRKLAVLCGVPVLQPTKLRDEAFLATIAGLRADLGVVAAYGRILPDALLAIPRLGMINVHASLLPA